MLALVTPAKAIADLADADLVVEAVVEDAGVKRAVILSPAFVADCLETREELGMRAADDLKAHGGESLTLVPGINASESWADAVVRIAGESSRWLSPNAAVR